MITIDSLLTPPDQWQWDYFKNANGQQLRYGWNCPAKAKALIIFAEGRTETAEEYFELIRDFNGHGFACAIMDWQGHGLSYRHNDDNTRQHSNGFEHDVNEFHLFLNHLSNIDDIQSLPRVLIAHSMGGNITLRYLSDHPDAFQCGVMVAPMLGLNPKRTIKYLGKALLSMADKFGWHRKYAPGQTAWNETFANIAKHKVSSHLVRRDLQPHLFKTQPELQCGGVTWGWLSSALKSITMLHDPAICAKITTPIFMGIGGKDIVVDNDGLQKTASLLPNCKTHLFQGAEHQIHRESDVIKADWMDKTVGFINSHLN